LYNLLTLIGKPIVVSCTICTSCNLFIPCYSVYTTIISIYLFATCNIYVIEIKLDSLWILAEQNIIACRIWGIVIFNSLVWFPSGF